jgi:CO dehydrogenase maturation factor
MKLSVCGKGGSGKSTLVCLLANSAEIYGYNVLVVDSDESNSGLHRMLGFSKPPMPLMELVGGKKTIKEKIGSSNIFNESNITTVDIPSRYIRKRDGLKLVSIGKILQSLEGCACPMGVLSREFLKKLTPNENEIVIADMEAGVEHFGRGIDDSIDTIILVVEPSMESIEVAVKIRDLTFDMKKDLRPILNKINSNADAEELKDILKRKFIDVIGVIPYDQEIFKAGFKGQAIQGYGAFNAAQKILCDLILTKKK